MFNLGFFEILVILVIALIVVGPKQLPELARKIARLINELKRTTDEVMKPVNQARQEAQNYTEQLKKSFPGYEPEDLNLDPPPPHEGDSTEEEPAQEERSDKNKSASPTIPRKAEDDSE